MNYGKFEGVEFIEQEVDIQAGAYIGCEFTRCIVRFDARLDVPLIVKGSHFESCSYLFGGAAERTLNYIAGLCVLSPEMLEMVIKGLRDGIYLSPQDAEAQGRPPFEGDPDAWKLG